MTQRTVKIKDFLIGEGQPMAVMCGPCVIESESHTLKVAEQLQKIFSSRKIPLIFKASYDKANRSSIHSFRGPGIEKGLPILQKVQKELGLPVVTDVHSVEEAKIAGSVLDIIQIPAFLCRQTDLLIAAAETPAAVNVKKGQFLAPWDMINVVQKIRESGNSRLILTDRGTSFGYNNLVSDFRAIPVMQEMGVPVCFDATHSVQLPGGLGKQSGGQRQFIPVLAKAAVAAGADCLFLEAHPEPEHALSDSSSVLAIKDLPDLLDTLLRVYEAIHK